MVPNCLLGEKAGVQPEAEVEKDEDEQSEMLEWHDEPPPRTASDVRGRSAPAMQKAAVQPQPEAQEDETSEMLDWFDLPPPRIVRNVRRRAAPVMQEAAVDPKAEAEAEHMPFQP